MTDPAPSPPQGAEASSSLWVWAPWFLGAGLLALGLAIWEPLPPGIWHDDGVYVLLGRALAEGEGLRYLGVADAPPAPKFPPLFPFLLSLVWRVFPGFPENVPALAGMNILVTAVAGGVFFAYVKRGLKTSGVLAFFLTILAWISAHLWRVAFIPLSEPLFLLCTVLALWAGARMEKKLGPGPVLVFLALAGLGVYARSLGVAVVVGGLLSLALGSRRRAALSIALGGFALLLPWLLWTRAAAASIPEPLRDTLGPYGGWLTSQILQQPGTFALFVWRNSGQLLSRVAALLLPGLSGFWLLLGLVLAPFLLLGLGELYRRSRLLPLALVASLGVLLLWPFQEIRLLVPFQPFLILALGLGFWRVLGHGQGILVLRLGTGAIALGWGLLFMAVSGARLFNGWTDESYRIRSAALMEGVRAVAEKTPPDAVVGAPELWSGIFLYTGRTVAPSARFHPLGRNAPVEGTPEEQYEIWITTGLTHILVEHGGRVHGEALDRVDALCPPGTVHLLVSRPGQFLVALAWDEACRSRVLEGGP